MSAVTRKQAEAVLAAVKKKYRHYLEDYNEDGLFLAGPPEEEHPKLIENWPPFYGKETAEPIRWAIVWEAGPDYWADRFGGGGFDEELYYEALELGEEAARKLAAEKPAKLPAKVEVEPYCGWALGIYPA